MTKKARFFRTISLAVMTLAALVVLGLPSSQALISPAATNDRCGPRTGGGCASVGALDVPTAQTPGRQVRQCYDFDTSATTAGPDFVDIKGDSSWPNDVWFRFPGPHCPGKKIVISTGGSTYVAGSYLVTQGGGGTPVYPCDITCGNVANNAFFNDDIVSPSTTGNYSVTIPASLANRDFYTVVNGGGAQILRYCVTSICP